MMLLKVYHSYDGCDESQEAYAEDGDQGFCVKVFHLKPPDE